MAKMRDKQTDRWFGRIENLILKRKMFGKNDKPWDVVISKDKTANIILCYIH